MSDGFTKVDPSHPLGGRDGGADAVLYNNGVLWIMAVYFPRGQKPLTEIQQKAIADSAGVVRNSAHGLVFVTNQELRLQERVDLANLLQVPIQLYHLEKLVAILDQPAMAGIREQYLHISATLPDLVRARADFLQRSMQESFARTAARWMGVGLPRGEAIALAEDRAIGAVSDEFAPSSERTLIVWTAPLGSGKSTAAERYYQQQLDRATDDPTAPLPVFLRARDYSSSLAAMTKAILEPHGLYSAGDPIIVVVDGIDESGYVAMERLLEDARVLVEVCDGNRVLMTSRPIPIATALEECVELPVFDESARQAFLTIGAGRQVGLGEYIGLSNSVRESISRPFFGILAGLWLRDGSVSARRPNGRIDLLALLGARSCKGIEDQDLLRRLAIHSIGRNYGQVNQNEILSGQSSDKLLATGLVEQDGQNLSFALPAVAQWFGAQALLLSEHSLQSIVEETEDTEFWIYPLAIALASGSSDHVERISQVLFKECPGLAFRVLEATFGGNRLSVQGGEVPPWREAGRKIRQAIQCLADALGPLSSLVLPLDESGRVLPIAVSGEGSTLFIAFWGGREHRPEITQWPENLHILDSGADWPRAYMGPISGGAAWALNWAWTHLVESMTKLVARRGIPLPLNGALAEEAIYVAACDLVGVSAWCTPSVKLSAITSSLNDGSGAIQLGETLTGRPLIRAQGREWHDYAALVDAISRRSNELDLSSVLPVADIETPRNGWVGNFYSDDRLTEIATQLYALAIQEYERIVERWFFSVREQLEHYILLPFAIFARIWVNRDDIAIPRAVGFFEALPANFTSRVHIEVGKDSNLQEEAFAAYSRSCLRRPNAARWLTGTWGGISFEIPHDFSIAEVVYSWISRDLARLGLVNGMTFLRPSEVVNCFDSVSS